MLLRPLITPLLVLLAGCADAASSALIATLIELDPVTRVAYTTDSGEPVIGMAVQARLVPETRSIVVLDFSEPYIRTFDGEGRVMAMFGDTGDGPSEMKLPTTLGVSSDSLIFVSDIGGRFTVFTMDGQIQFGPAFLDFPPFAAVRVCGDRWLLYGPRFSQNPEIPEWVHELTISGDDVNLRSSFADPLAGSIIAPGKPYGMAATPDGAIIRHMLGSEPSLIRWSCDGEVRVQPLEPPFDWRSTSSDANGVGVIAADDRSDMGMAYTGDGVLLADAVSRASVADFTEMLYLDGKTSQSVAVEGDYILRDASDGLLLIEKRGVLNPYLFILTADSVLRAIQSERPHGD